MKKYIWILAFLLISGYAIGSVTPLTVDWSGGKITVIGSGAAPKEASPAEGKLVARVFAEVDAHKKLTDAVSEIKVNDNTIVKNYIEKSTEIKNKIESLVKSANVVSINYFDDNIANYQLEIPIFLGLGPIIYPILITSESTPTLVGAAPTIERTSTKEAVYTGLIVEVGTSEYQPALLPRILDKNGAEVYGAKNIYLNYVLGFGSVYYSASTSEAKADTSRIGSNPLFVKAKGISGSNKCDVVVSDEDSYNITAFNNKSKFLNECRVVFVLKK